MRKPYPKYKSPYIAWLNQMPQHWEEVRYKYLFKEINERSEKGEEDLLSVSQYTGVTLRKDNIEEEKEHLTNASSLEGYKKVKTNDLVINIMLAWNGSLGVSPFQGIASPAYCVYRGTSRVFPKYYHYLVRTDYSKGDFKKVSTGVVDSRLRMYTDDLFQLYTILPPLPEQTQIANFLDYKCVLIDTAIQKKTRIIELLKEQKQAIINRAVTRGLNPNTPMKDSGIEWLGEIPAHWEVKRIKYLLHGIIDTEHKTVEFVESGQYLVVRTSNVKNGELRLENAKYTDEKGFIEWTRRGIPKAGDILLTREAPAGEVCLIPENIPLCLGQRMVWLKVNHSKLNAQYGVYSIYAELAQEFIRNLSGGSTVVHFNMGDIGNIPLLLPLISEQKKIVDFIFQECKTIDTAISRIEREIELIKEYKAALIAEAVTGKIDVRDWKPKSKTNNQVENVAKL